MLGYRQRVEVNRDDRRMIIRGENALVASPKEQVMKIMNLSGKRTRIGRNSGERFRLSYVEPPKRKADFR